VCIGAEFDAHDLEFLQAIDRYKREKRRPFPTWGEALAVLRALGWRKATPAAGPGAEGRTGEGEKGFR
jgi:hypothetical protein